MPGDFTMQRRVQFAETDMAGVMHFANYYRLMEEAEHAFWRSRGLSVLHEVESRHVSWPRVLTSCEYFAPAHFEDELELRFRIVHVGKKSLEFEVEFRRQDQRLALGRTKAVCCEMKPGAFRSIAIPDTIRAVLAGSDRPG